MAEPLFNVVIERPRSPAPDAAAALAAAISARYGIPAADLERRIARGQFRVKSRVDRATADTYAADLVRLGAVCAVVPADEPNSFRPQPIALGRRAGGFFEVRSGLEEGARLAVSGAFTLKSALRSGELSEGHEH